MYPHASMRKSGRAAPNGQAYRHGRAGTMLHKDADHNWDRRDQKMPPPVPTPRKTHWDSVQEWDPEQGNSFGKYYPETPEWTGPQYPQGDEMGRIPRPSERLRMAMSYEEDSYNAYYDPPPQSYNYPLGPPMPEASGGPFPSFKPQERQPYANEEYKAVDSSNGGPTRHDSTHSAERRGLDIVNPSTGEKVVVAHSGGSERPPTTTLTPTHRVPLPITDPSTGKRVSVDKKVAITDPKTGEPVIIERKAQANPEPHSSGTAVQSHDAPSQAVPDPAANGARTPLRPGGLALNAPPFFPKHLRPIHEGAGRGPSAPAPAVATDGKGSKVPGVPSLRTTGRRKLDEQSLSDLAREHSGTVDVIERPASVPSPDSLSMDDTPGPSDEEKEPFRFQRRASFHVLEERFRSRSASPRLYRFYSDYSPTPTPRVRKVYGEDALRRLNTPDPRIPTPLRNPLLEEILVVDTAEYIARKQEESASDAAEDLANRAEDPFALKRGVEDDAVLRKITGILNKLTPEKYEVLLQSMYDVLDQNSATINEQLLERIIGEVHECALDQPNYSEMYAVLCSDVCTRIHGNEEKSGQRRSSGSLGVLENFRRILLNKCQARFMEGVEHIQAKEAAGLETEVDAADQKYRTRTKGNVRFIGELFKWSMLSERIMHKVIKKLLLDMDHATPGTADALEILCTLFQAAGKELDRPKAGEYMSHYFKSLSALSKEHPLPRIRFLILDIIALRENGWTERRRDSSVLKLSPVKEPLGEDRTKDQRGPGAQNKKDAQEGRSRHPEGKGRRPSHLVPAKVGSPGKPAARGEGNGSFGSDGGSDRPCSTPGISPISLGPTGPSPHAIRMRDAEWRPSPQHYHPPGVAPLDGQLNTVTEEDLRFEAKAQMMLDEWHITGQDVGSVLYLIDEIPVPRMHQFWVCALEFTSRTNKYERYRANLVLLIRVFLHHCRLSVPGVIGSVMGLIDRACRLENWVDSPGIWRNLSGMIVELMAMGILSFEALVDMCCPFFQQRKEEPCREFLSCIMHTIHATRQGWVYNPQVALTLCQALNIPPRCRTVMEFLEVLAV